MSIIVEVIKGIGEAALLLLKGTRKKPLPPRVDVGELETGHRMDTDGKIKRLQTRKRNQ